MNEKADLSERSMSVKKVVNITKTSPCNIQRFFFFSCKKLKISPEKKNDIFNIFAQNIDHGYTLEPQSIFGPKIRKIGIPLQPQFYYIKVGVKGVGVFIARACFPDEERPKRVQF